MGKKKINDEEDLVDTNNSISKELIKKYGNVFLNGNHIIERKRDIISVSPKIDLVIGGGVCSGSVFTLAGKPKCGKSQTSLSVARNAQIRGYKIFYIDIENRLKARDLVGIKDLKADEVDVVRSVRGKILTGEEYLEITENLINSHPKSVIIADSISQLCLESEHTSDLDKRDRSPGAGLMAKFIKRNAGAISVNDIILICIQHLIANLGNTNGHGPQFVKSGGNKVQFQGDLGLIAKSVKYDKIGEKNDIGQKSLGQEVEWFVEFSSLSAPCSTATSYIRYGRGVCDITENIQLAIELGLIEGGGSGGWMSLAYLGEGCKKMQGQEKLFQYFDGGSGREDYNILVNKIQEILYA